MTDATAEENDAETLASVNSIILTSSLLALIAIGYRINTHRLRHLPESGAAMACGFVVGLAVRALGLTEEERLLDFRGEIFFFVLLPPIIFEAGLSLETRMFVDNLGAIFTFAVFGTLVSTWFVSMGLYHAAKAGLVGLADTPRLAGYCQLFGALISATDPVATIALFGSSRFRADPLLHSLINGESVLNDAVAIVLFGSLSQHATENPHVVSFPVLSHFFFVGGGSVLVGLASGALCSWCFCRAAFLRKFPDYEISGMCLSAYLTFAFSELVGLSGIVALFFFGIVLAQYNWYNLSEPSKVASKVTFGTLAKLAEACVFIYLGIVAALSIGRFHWHLGLVLYSLVVIVLARAAHIFPFAIMLNLGRERKIDRNMCLMLWVSGLRGAIAFALSLRIPCATGGFGRRGTDECRNSDLLVTTTISVVVLTTLVIGTAMERVATALRLIEPAAAGEEDLSVPLAALGSLDVDSESSTRFDALPGGEDASSLATCGSVSDRTEGGHAPSDGVERTRSWTERFNARGHVYQAFARFDVGVLQPMLGGPCRQRVVQIGQSGGSGGSEIPSLQNFMDPPGRTRHWQCQEDDEPPTWSRSAIFE